MALVATYDPTSLFAGDTDIVARSVTYASGTFYKRGALLGRAAVGAVSSAVKASGANTGNGTFVPDVSTPALANAMPGVYTLRCTVAGTNSATFRLSDPKGDTLADYAFNGAGASVTVADQVKGVLTDGATDFIVGDGFDVTVAAADKYKTCVATATDGSQVPSAVAACDVDATGGDTAGPAYVEGEFAGEIMILDASWTIATVQAATRIANGQIFVRQLGVLG